MQPRGAQVTIEQVSHRYHARGETVLKEINASIEPGERVALVGRSGCGKSTLLQIIAGLARPTSGAVRIDGKLVHEPSAKWNVMFQKPSLYPWMNVSQNAALGMTLAGDGRRAKRRVPELLRLVEMEQYAQANVQRLSGGQQQRVALARSLATDPELLLLDEPFAALDIITRRLLQMDVVRIVAECGVTLVLVTHDTEEAILMADRVLVMSRAPGRIVADLAVPLPSLTEGAGRSPEDPGFKAFQNELRRLIGFRDDADATNTWRAGRMADPHASEDSGGNLNRRLDTTKG